MSFVLKLLSMKKIRVMAKRYASCQHVTLSK